MFGPVAAPRSSLSILHIRSFVSRHKSQLFIKIHAQGRTLPVKTLNGIRKREKNNLKKRLPLRNMAVTQKAPFDQLPVSMPLPKPQEKWKENLNIHMICKDCKEIPPNLIESFSSGDTVCGSCGLVLGERIIDTRSEWRTFSNDDQAGDDPSRVGDGGNPLLNGSQLQTTISFGDGSPKTRELARAQSKATHDKANKNLLSAYKEIGAHCEAISATKNVADLAKILFKNVSDAGAFKGKSTEAIIAGCIFIACRQCNAARTFKEVFSLTKVPKAEIGRVFKALEKFFASQNKAKTDAIVDAGGKSSLTSFCVLCEALTLSSKVWRLWMATTPKLPQLVQKTSVSATVVSFSSKLASRCLLKSLQQKPRILVLLLVVRRFLLRLPVFTWLHT